MKLLLLVTILLLLQLPVSAKFTEQEIAKLDKLFGYTPPTPFYPHQLTEKEKLHVQQLISHDPIYSGLQHALQKKNELEREFYTEIKPRALAGHYSPGLPYGSTDFILYQLLINQQYHQGYNLWMMFNPNALDTSNPLYLYR